MRVRSVVLLALGVVVVGGVALTLTGLDGFSARSEPSAVERLMARIHAALCRARAHARHAQSGGVLARGLG